VVMIAPVLLYFTFHEILFRAGVVLSVVGVSRCCTCTCEIRTPPYFLLIDSRLYNLLQLKFFIISQRSHLPHILYRLSQIVKSKKKD
jgi:hypothetical protein